MPDSQIEKLLPGCVVFLDGLDEIPQGPGIESIRLFMQEHSQTRFVVTARSTADYHQLGSLRILRLLDLEDEQVHTIMGPRWETANESVRQLARNRTLLKLILTQPDNPTIWTKGHLVWAKITKQIELIHDAANRELVDDIIGNLAFSMHRGQTYRFNDRKIIEVLDAYLQEWHEARSCRGMAALLCDEDVGLMKHGEDGGWGFCDRLTQAYYAAAAITRDPTLLLIALERATDPWWFEIWDLLVGLSTEPSELMLNLIDRDPIAAARCLVFSGVPLTTNLTNALFDALHERRSFGRSADRVKVVECLGWFNDPKTRKKLLKTIREDRYSSVVLLAVGKYCQLVQQDTSPLPPIRVVKAAIRKSDSEEAITGLFGLWRKYISANNKQQQVIESYLINLLHGSRLKKHVNGVIAILLGLIGTDSAREALYATFMQNEIDEFLAWCVTDALGQTQHPATEEVAIDLLSDAEYKGDEHINQRARAIHLLGWMSPRGNTQTFVINALRDDSPEIRRRAAQSLGRWRIPGSRELLEDQLRREQDEKVIDRFVQALGKVDNVETLLLLEACLRRALRAATRRHIHDAMDEIRLRHAA